MAAQCSAGMGAAGLWKAVVPDCCEQGHRFLCSGAAGGSMAGGRRVTWRVCRPCLCLLHSGRVKADSITNEDILRAEIPWPSFHAASIITKEQLEMIYHMDKQPINVQIEKFEAVRTAHVSCPAASHVACLGAPPLNPPHALQPLPCSLGPLAAPHCSSALWPHDSERLR